MGKTPTVEIIRRQIQHYTPTDEDLVQYLVSNYPFYRRTKRKQLQSMVREARMSQVETELTARNYKDEDSREDGIYDEELEPKMDLIKDALRDKYVKQAKVNEACAAEKNMEVEVDQKSEKAVHGGKKRKIGDCEVQKKNHGPRFSNMGGMSQVLDMLTKQVLLQFGNPRLRSFFGVKPVTGILLHGPPGCGKTMLASAIANEARLPFYKICATEIVSGVSGDSEQNIRELFSKAARTAPSIVFIDEIDAIALKRKGAQSEMGWRIVTQLNKCMDEIRQAAASSDSTPELSDQSSRHVLVIAATNHPDEIDPALRRPGRFDREIYLGVPDEKARIHILSVLTRRLKYCEGSLDLLKIARLTPGYVGADLDSLVDTAGNLAMLRIVEGMRNKVLNETQEDGDAVEWWRQPWLPSESENPSMGDFEEALKEVQPSLKREGFSSIPDVKWEDVGGLDDLRKVFTSHIVKQIMCPGKSELYGLKFDKGFLLYGPPGCGKTLLAKAVANEAGANFIHIKGPEILNKYVGESETAVRAIFNRARTCAPCIIFFDEVDALTRKRGEEGGRVHESVALQLMMELDGGDKRSGVYVIGATNRRDAMDPAFLRPGRFGKHLYVGYPNPDQRAQILKAICRKFPIDSNVDLDALARSATCENFSGADLSALVHEASVTAFNEDETLEESGCEAVVSVSTKHFKKALAVISGSRRWVKRNEKNSRNQIGGCAAKCAAGLRNEVV